jgi:hypothetical protein
LTLLYPHSVKNIIMPLESLCIWFIGYEDLLGLSSTVSGLSDTDLTAPPMTWR